MDFSQKLHRIRAAGEIIHLKLSLYRPGLKINIRTKPKNEIPSCTYSPVWALTFSINTMYGTILPISFFLHSTKTEAQDR